MGFKRIFRPLEAKIQLSEIFKKRGEEFFRIHEKKEVLKALEKRESVISLGGGAFMNKMVRDRILQDSISIWLDLNIKELNKRISWNKKRPLLDQDKLEQSINKIYSERKKIYNESNFRIKCNSMDKDEIIYKIIELYEKQ